MRHLFLLLILLTPVLVLSQQNASIYTISGKIVDAKTEKPLEDATIVFKRIADNKVNFGTITNHRGNFSLEIEASEYEAVIEYISYKTKKIQLPKITRDLKLGTIKLEENSELLSSVEITAEKKAVYLKPKKQIFNISKDPGAANLTATEALSKLPSVSVDLNGNVQLRGQSNVTILINGKLSSLSKSEALKTLPAGSIQDIEVITNPGARFRASSLGVINIILKKGKDEGLNSSLTVNGGYNDYYGGLFTFNNKTEKVNFFSNFSFLKRNPIKEASITNEYFNNGTTLGFMNEDRETRGNGNVLGSYAGVEINLSKRSKLTTSVNYTNISDANYTETVSDFFDNSKNFTNTNTRINDGTFKDEVFEVNADYEKTFKKEGQVLNISLNYSNDVEQYNNVFTNTDVSFFTEDYIEKNTLENTRAEITFLTPLSETSEFQIGYLGEFGKTPFTYASALTESLIIFNDRNHAFYADYSNQKGKFYYQFGLRMEFLRYDISYANSQISQVKDFNNLFPSAYLEYAFTDSKNLSFSYTKAYIPPSYYVLQPFEQQISETVSFVGNENVNPVFANSYELKYLYYNNQLTFSTSFFYSKYVDFFRPVLYEEGTVVNGVNKLISSIYNVSDLERSGIDFTTVFRPTKWISFTGNAILYQSIETGVFETVNSVNQQIIQDYGFTNFSGELSFSTDVRINNGFNFQANLKHFLSSESALSERKAYTYFGASLSKDILQKNATLGLSTVDLFNSQKTDRNRYDTGYFSRSYERNKYPTILISFTYRFNQKKQNRNIDFGKKEVKPRL